MSRAVRVVISGRVQRVGFRYWTEGEANKLGLDGWVRNMPDGTVEAVFSGADDAVALMLERCHTGPRLAAVRDVQVFDAEAPEKSGFAHYR